MTASQSTTFDAPLEARGEAPSRDRMVGRRVLVIGAGQTDYNMADQPIGNGRAISILLAREGARVVAADYDKAAADQTVELITAAGGEAATVVADVSDPGDIEEMVDRARDWLGGLDGIVYNVGIPGPQEGFSAATPEAWDQTLNVNLRGAMLTARAALPVLEPGSAFVFISSIAALGPRGRQVAYESSKAGMAALTRSVAFEGRGRSIRANVVLPGLIDTGMARDHNPEAATVYAGSPLGRAGTGWDIAYATLFLLSHESTYITGQALNVDGGTKSL